MLLNCNLFEINICYVFGDNKVENVLHQQSPELCDHNLNVNDIIALEVVLIAIHSCY